MSLIHSSLLLGAGAAAGGSQIERSLRCNSSDSAFCSRVPSTAGNRKTWTWAGWVKRSTLSSGYQTLFSGGSGAGRLLFGFGSGDTFSFELQGAGSHVTTAVFRDPSAWYHVVVAFDTTQATAADRTKVWINNTLQTLSGLTFSQNTDYAINSNVEHRIGCQTSSVADSFNGYLADIHFIDGQALDPSSFTTTDPTTGQLIPKAYAGTYGTNGFHLPFSDNSATTTTTLGKDTSGNGNNWTPNNLSVLTGNFNIANASLTPPSSGFLSGRDLKIYAFDGDTSNYLLANSSNDNYSVNFSPAISVNSSVEIYGLTSGQQASTNLSSAVTYTSGTFTTIFSGSGSLTQITMIAVGNRPALARIRVDGVELISTLYASGNDSLVDTPTSYGTDTGAGGEVRGNYCVINPLDNGGGLTLSNGNLEAENTAASSKGARCTIKIPSTGKWYFEGTIQTLGGASSLGVATSASANPYLSAPGTWHILNYAPSGIQSYPGGRGYTFTTGQVGNVLQVAYDADSGKLWFGVNNTYCDGSNGGTGNPSAGTNPTYTSVFDVFPAVEQYTSKIAVNFGQRPFAYTAPNGFKALVDTNLTSTTITTSGTYTGNGVADGPFVYLNGVPTAMTIGGNAVTFGTHADKLANGFKIRTSSTTYNQNASSYNYSITSTDAAFKNARAQPNP